MIGGLIVSSNFFSFIFFVSNLFWSIRVYQKFKREEEEEEEEEYDEDKLAKPFWRSI